MKPHDATGDGDGDWLYQSVRSVVGSVYRVMIPVKVVGVENFLRKEL